MHNQVWRWNRGLYNNDTQGLSIKALFSLPKFLRNKFLAMFFVELVCIHMAFDILEKQFHIGNVFFSRAPKRLLEMSSVAGNNRIIPAIDKLDN